MRFNSLFVSFALIPVAWSSGFHKALNHIKAASDKAFHDALLKQLADSRPKVSNADLSLGDVVVAATTNGTGFGDGSTSSFQLYTQDLLPTSPAPSSACAAALTATIQCNSTIPLMSSYPFLLINDLASVCTSQCAASLASYRTNVVSACKNFGISTSNNISYVPTLGIDTIAGPYTVQCLQDPTSKSFCQPLLASLNSTGGLLTLPNSELCTFCPLKTLNATLSNPVTYSTPVAQLLSSAITQCGSQFASYNVSAPGSGTITTPPFGQPPSTNPAADCAIAGHNISITSDTTCSAVAQANSLTVYSVLSSNPSLVGSADCTVKSGSKLCLFEACHLYKVATNDTCDSISEQSASIIGTHITSTQLQAYNPDLGTYCQLIVTKLGQNICLTPYGGLPNVSASSDNNQPSGTPTSQAAIPTPTMPGTASACGRYYKVETGDVCNTVSLANAVSLPDFYTLNPQIDTNCTNLWLGYYVCVAPFPPFASNAPPPPVTTNFTSATLMTIPLPTASYTPTFQTQILTPAGIPAPTNVAAGTRTVNCGFYYNVQSGDTWNPELVSSAPVPGTALCIMFPKGNYTLSPAPIPSNVAPNVTTASCAQYDTIVAGDTCTAVEKRNFIDHTQFLTLNPGVNSQCTNIVLGLAYCVFSIYAPVPSNSTAPPANLAPGTITAGCTKYYTIVSGDGCASVESKFNITLTQLIQMNPELNSQCTNLALGEAYCVASSNSTSTGTGPPANLAPGTITAGCTKYYTIVSGDGCASVDSKFNITLTQLIQMNPELNSQCTNLALGEAYCVASSNSTSTGSGPPGNLAAGSLSNCTSYHTVVSGDTCNAMETSAKIAFSDILRWNPEINTACTNILLNEAYCVGGGGKACGKLYLVVSGDTCATIVQKQKVTQATINTLNPWINSACSNLAVGQNVCVG
ncbi:hypothetical protein C8F01DRAFT_1368795 [Mycena amicta]|nr:hypothetical protein C8F01DRAFT_1368795 [Mycena amicta]